MCIRLRDDAAAVCGTVQYAEEFFRSDEDTVLDG